MAARVRVLACVGSLAAFVLAACSEPSPLPTAAVFGIWSLRSVDAVQVPVAVGGDTLVDGFVWVLGDAETPGGSLTYCVGSDSGRQLDGRSIRWKTTDGVHLVLAYGPEFDFEGSSAAVDTAILTHGIMRLQPTELGPELGSKSWALVRISDNPYTVPLSACEERP